MLVLSRQKDETIMIGDDVEITVVDIRGDKVRLGITAPPHIPVHRKEVYEAIKRENRAASQVRPEDIGSIANSESGAADSAHDVSGRSAPAKRAGSNGSKPRVRKPGGRVADKNSVSGQESESQHSVGTNAGREGTLPEGA
jgi:carbon storage regulator